MPVAPDAVVEIARRSRGTPRIANLLLRRVRDFAQIKGDGKIDLKISQYALTALNVDKHGLDEMDNKILLTIIDKFKKGDRSGSIPLPQRFLKIPELLKKYTSPFSYRKVISCVPQEAGRLLKLLTSIFVNLKQGLKQSYFNDSLLVR